MLALLVALGAAGPVRAAQGEAEPTVHRIPMDRQGRIPVTALVEVLLREAGSQVTLPRSRRDETIRVGGMRGHAVVLGLHMLLRDQGIGFRIRGGALEIHLDRAKLGQHADSLEETLRDLLGVGPPVFRLERVDSSDARGPPVVLVHGLNSGPERMAPAAKALAAAGYDVYVFRYPNDGRIEESARGLGQELRRLYAKRKGKISLVTASMGGVVARVYLELDPDYGGEVSHFVACCPPFGGAPLARYHVAHEIVETVRDMVSHGFDGLFVFDGLGQAAFDLQKDSELMKRLAKTRRRRQVRYSILAGKGDIVPPAVLQAIDAAAQALREDAEPPEQVGLDLLAEATRVALGAAGTQGDGAVTLNSQKLRGVKDRVVLPLSHLDFLVPGEDGKTVGALDEVVRRLPKP